MNCRILASSAKPVAVGLSTRLHTEQPLHKGSEENNLEALGHLAEFGFSDLTIQSWGSFSSPARTHIKCSSFFHSSRHTHILSYSVLRRGARVIISIAILNLGLNHVGAVLSLYEAGGKYVIWTKRVWAFQIPVRRGIVTHCKNVMVLQPVATIFAVVSMWECFEISCRTYLRVSKGKYEKTFYAVRETNTFVFLLENLYQTLCDLSQITLL